MLTPVQLLKHYSIYNSGEIAGFPPEKADELVKAGIAARVAATSSVEPPPPPVDPKPAEPVVLDKLTNAELVALAKAEFDLALDAKSKKAELIAAIEAARAAKA